MAIWSEHWTVLERSKIFMPDVWPRMRVGECASGFKAVRDLQLQTLSFEIFNDAAFAGGLAPSFLGATQPSG